MNRYKVAVLVEYHVTAKDTDDAWSKIEEGAEFPVVPYDDETYCNKVHVIDAIELSQTVTT
jgi:hypothetical protein